MNEISGSKDPINLTRDKIAERSDKLTEKSAQKLFEVPFEKFLSELTEADRELLFQTARDESELSKDGKYLWGNIFNSYVALVTLIKGVRKPGEYVELPLNGDYASELFASSNRLGAVFALFRKHKDMSELEARQLLELAHSTALAGVSSEARAATFAYAFERGVTLFEVANQYILLADLIASVKRPLYADLV